jgi:hypothetical protein
MTGVQESQREESELGKVEELRSSEVRSCSEFRVRKGQECRVEEQEPERPRLLNVAQNAFGEWAPEGPTVPRTCFYTDSSHSV